METLYKNCENCGHMFECFFKTTQFCPCHCSMKVDVLVTLEEQLSKINEEIEKCRGWTALPSLLKHKDVLERKIEKEKRRKGIEVL